MNAEEQKEFESRLWEAADKLRADSGLKPSQYSVPVLGLIFLRFASIKYKKYREEIQREYEASLKGRNIKKLEDIALVKCGFYLPDKSDYDYLLDLPEQQNIPKAIKEAMEEIEKYKPELEGCLPKDEYFELILPGNGKEDFSLAKQLLRILKDIPEDISGDLFGKVYEYFLSRFALAEGQGGGQFFTPTSVVRLMVEMIEPYGGTIFDPACGSGGMFVQSADFVQRQREAYLDSEEHELFVCGVEKDGETVKIARMNMFLNGLRNEIYKANSYYDDPFDCLGKFDFVMANPPFNVDDVNLERVKVQERFNRYGVPQNKTKKTGGKQDSATVPNANYLWINLFATSLNEKGRAALVMANSASDARNTEAEIRQRLVESGIINCMLSLPKNMFYTVTLPATLWFFDKARQADKRILFIDARNIFRQVDRAHREFTDEHIRNLACIRHLFQGDRKYWEDTLKDYQASVAELTRQIERLEVEKKVIEGKAEQEEKKAMQKRIAAELTAKEAELKKARDRKKYMQEQYDWLKERFPEGQYADVTGLCKAASLEEIAEQDYSLNPGRYVGVVIEEDGLTEEEFKQDMVARHQKLDALHSKANDLMKVINQNWKELFG